MCPLCPSRDSVQFAGINGPRSLMGTHFAIGRGPGDPGPGTRTRGPGVDPIVSPLLDQHLLIFLHNPDLQLIPPC